MNNRLVLRAVTLGLLCVLFASGCVPTDSGGDDDALTPEITVVLESSTPSLNPYGSTLAQRRIGRLVFQGLTTIGSDGTPLADLCAEVPTLENGGISADGKTVRYKLREASFHDGRSVTAADVVFTIDRLRAGDLVDEPGIDLGSIVSAKALDQRTVEVKFSRPDTSVAWRLAPFVLPAHLLSESKDLLSDPFWLRPVGSGPYQVTDVLPGASARLVNTRSDGGPRSLDVAFVPNASAARAVYDDAPNAVWIDAPVDSAGATESRVTTDSAAWWRLSPTTDSGSTAADPSVRWAVRALVESEWVTETARAATGPYGYVVGRTPSEITTPQIAARLKRAGWTRGKDGVRVKGGRPLEVLVRTPGLDGAEGRVWDRVRARALEAGMMLDIRPSGSQYYGNVLERGVVARAEGDYFLTALPVGAPAGYAWPYDPDDTPSFDNPYGLNWQRLAGRRASEWTARIREASTPEAAARIMRSVWAELDGSDELVWLYPTEESVLAKRVTGVEAHPFAEMSLTGVSDWRLVE